MKLPDTTTEQGQREASVMLARLIPDWEVEDLGHRVYIHIKDGGVITFARDNTHEASLYDPVYMALAWKVLNWANNSFFGGDTRLDQWHWWHDFVADMRLLPPAAAQRAWLNKVLTLAIEAGMIEAQP